MTPSELRAAGWTAVDEGETLWEHPDFPGARFSFYAATVVAKAPGVAMVATAAVMATSEVRRI